MSAANTRHDDTGSDNSLAAYLAEHPRMMGVLFAALALMMQFGSAAAGTAINLSGP